MSATLWILGFALLRGGDDQLAEQLRKIERELQSLIALKQGVSEGYLPDVAELREAGVSRHRILREFDARRAVLLGFGAQKMEDRLLAGFSAELRVLGDMSERHQREWSSESSPLLLLLHEFERETLDEAIRLLHKQGLVNPLEKMVQDRSKAPKPAAGTPSPGPEAGPGDGVTPAPAPATTDALLTAERFYSMQRYAEALAAYELVDLATVKSPLNVRYRLADCRMQTGSSKKAAEEFRQIAEETPDSALGSQARWAASYAEALLVLDRQKLREGGNP